MYETKEALTKFVPRQYEGVIDYVEVKGRTKITVKGRISDYIPNPTFEKVAAPGAQEEYFKRGNPEGKSPREIMGKPIAALPAFREPGPRLELMDEQGVGRILLWPTLASLIEERLRNDPRPEPPAHHRRHRVGHRPRAAEPLPPTQDRARRERGVLGATAPRLHGVRLPDLSPTLRGGPGRRVPAQRLRPPLPRG